MKHLNYLLRRRIAEVISDAYGVRVRWDYAPRVDGVSSDTYAEELRDAWTGVLRRCQPEVLRRLLVAAASAGEIGDHAPTCSAHWPADDDAVGLRRDGAVATEGESRWCRGHAILHAIEAEDPTDRMYLEVCRDELVAVAEGFRARWDLEYETYRTACLQGVAVPPGEGG